METYAGSRFEPSAPSGHVESYFLKANDPHSQRAIWLKWTIFARNRLPRAASADVWAIAFDTKRGHVGVKSSVPFAEARFSKNVLDVLVDGCTLDATSTAGDVASGGRSVGWELSIAGRGQPLVQYPYRWMYEGPLPTSKTVSPIPDARVSGRIEVNGATWELDAWPAVVGHNWGTGHYQEYAWGHCNAWDDPSLDLMLEGGSGRIKLGPVLLPPRTILFVRHRGVRYELNTVFDLVKNRGEISTRRWKFQGESALARIDGEMRAETEDFVGLFYPNPDGKMTYCLNSKLARADVSFTLSGRAPIIARSHKAALELGTHNPHHGVRMYV